MTTGKASIVAAAICAATCAPAKPPTLNNVTIWGMVIMLHFLITISGQSTSFHEPMKVVIPTVISEGLERGQKILNNTE